MGGILDTPSGQPSGEVYAYLFEAKGIQRYIFDSGMLRDIIGASDLVAGLSTIASGGSAETGATSLPKPADAGPANVTAGNGSPAETSDDDLVGTVIRSIGCEDSIRYSRRSGGAFCLHCDDHAALERIKTLFRLLVSLTCPGLEFSDSGPCRGVNDINALNNAYALAGTVRNNSAAELPPVGNPFTAFNPRTGRVATKQYFYRKKGQVERKPADGMNDPQRRRAHQLQSARGQGQLDRVARRFLPPDAIALDGSSTFVFPRNLETEEESSADNPNFPFLGRDRRIAIVHADLSGLGQIFQKVTDPQSARKADAVLAISALIEDLIENAARAATGRILLPASVDLGDAGDIRHLVPARPVLLGGDDITILVRADLSVNFAAQLLKNIEDLSRQMFGEPGRNHDLPAQLSACAGIAVFNAGRPFSTAHELAEDLCGFAKKRAKQIAQENKASAIPSFLAFHNAQTSTGESYETLAGRELTATNPQTLETVKLSGNPYSIGEYDGDGCHKLSDLMKLAGALTIAQKGSAKLIEVAGSYFGDFNEAIRKFNRWDKVLRIDDPAAYKAVKEALSPFDKQDGEAKPEGAHGAGIVKFPASVIGPLNDALELLDLGTSVDAFRQNCGAEQNE